ncbi:MAG: 16S rRNA (cytosine(967)-C(5))-methyltransferase RsmB [Bacteroidetes bacterium]|nr:16S rRNA (cytosine(967)-C(5))-methyltransferase RsmB [Bacteroidota bacterium]
MDQLKEFGGNFRVDADLIAYETAREIAVKILNRVERTDSYLDKLLDSELRNSDLTKLDKSFLTELVNGTIRWKLRLDYVISQFYRGDYSKVDINIKNAIRVAIYQIMFLERVPKSAAVNEAVEFVKKLRGQYLANLVNAVLRTTIRKLNVVEYPSIEDDAVRSLATIHSFPQWLVRRFIDRFGVYETEQLLSALNERPRLSIRVNERITPVDTLVTYMEDRGMRVSRAQYLPNFLYVEGLSRIGELESFRAGKFTVQDESAGIVTKLLAPQEGETILDMCAAPGGKTTHILEMTGGKVHLTAVEKYENRAMLIQNLLDRMGYRDVKVKVADGITYSDDTKYDKILIDVPCTGFGVIRKKPDSKWKREPEDIEKLKVIQMSIINNTAKLLKPNGTLVYSTCTIEEEENESVVANFLGDHPEFELEAADNYVERSFVSKRGFVETLPHRHDMDGGFAARLRKVK